MYQKKILTQHYFSHVKNICRDNKLREFYLKLLHRIVVTKRELFTYGIAENALCPRCKQNDSIIHTFCYCHRTTSFFFRSNQMVQHQRPPPLHHPRVNYSLILIMIERIKAHRKLSKSSILLSWLLNITCT